MANRRRTSEEKIAAYEEGVRQLKARMQREAAKLRDVNRKNDTRRKILAGSLALKHHDGVFEVTLQRLIEEYVVRPDERALFGLDPLPGNQAPAHEHESPSDAAAYVDAVADAAEAISDLTDDAPSTFRDAAE